MPQWLYTAVSTMLQVQILNNRFVWHRIGDLPEAVNWILLVIILILNIWFFVIWFKSLVIEFIKERKAAKAQQEQEKQAKKEQEAKVQEGDETQRLADAKSPPEEMLQVPADSPKKQIKEKKPFLSYFSRKKKENPITVHQD